MIKFFRHIRQRMIKENRTTKYLLYAIGEIILVVIGILIALNVNNYNEGRIKEAKITKALNEIHSELSSDIQESERLIEYYARKDSMINLILTDKVNFDSYKNSPSLPFTAMNYWSLIMDDNGFKLLMQNTDDIPPKYESLIVPLKTIYVSHKSGIEDRLDNLLGQMDPFYLWLDQNTPWKADFMFNREVSDEAIDFFLNDPYYRNYVQTYHNRLIENLYAATLWFRIDAEITYAELTKALNLEDEVANDSTLYKVNYSDHAHFVGTYKDSANTAVISLESDSLFYQYDDGLKSDLIPISNHLFLVESSYHFNRIDYDSIGQVLSHSFQLGRTKRTLIKEIN